MESERIHLSHGFEKRPTGYTKNKPVAIDVYSNKTSYYADGDMYAKMAAVRYDGNLLTDIPYEK